MDVPAGSVRVLHVDDDPEFAAMTADMLEREDDRFDVETVEDAGAGLDELEAGTFDCVVSDYQMPGRDGIEFLESVRADHPDLPFVLFTGKGSEAVASEAISAGVTDYLQKGSGTQQYELLANRIETAVGQYRAERELERSRERYRSLFENNPLVLWEEDFSACKRHVDALAERVEDVEGYLERNPDEVRTLLSKIDIIDVNRNALDYYGADSKAELMDSLDRLTTEESLSANSALWAAVAAGETRFRTETVSRTFAGDRRREILEVSVPEAHADDYSRVYVSSIDIDDRQ